MAPKIKPQRIRILIVDDHFYVRLGVAASLNCEPDLQVIAEASNGPEALQHYRKHQPDLTILDYELPGQNGVEITEKLVGEFPGAKVLLLSIHAGEEDVFRATKAGALGYLPKGSPREELVQAVRAVAAGQRFLPSALAAILAARTNREEISPRELEVLRLIVEGLSNKEIADRLTLAEPTVKQHIRSLLYKMGVADRTQATTEALRRGLVRLK